MKIWLIRHGETRTGPDGLYRHWHGLTTLGVEQADQVAQAISKHRIDMCYSSALPRAEETMERFIRLKSVPETRIPALNEIEVGNLQEASPEDKKAVIEHRSNLDFSVFGGEDPETFYQRVVDGWQSLIDDAIERNAVQVAAFLHAGTIAAILDHGESKPFDYRSRPRMPNCSYSLIEVRGKVISSKWNGWETSHLTTLT